MNIKLYPSVKLITVSSSKLGSLSCDRYYFWNWVLNLVPRKLNLPLWFGAVMHAAFETMVRTKDINKILKAMDVTSKKELSKYALVSEDNAEIQLQIQRRKALGNNY